MLLGDEPALRHRQPSKARSHFRGTLLPCQGVACMLPPVSVSAATLLREARTDAGLSRRALAAKAGVPTSTVSRIEDEQTEPSYSTLDRLIEAAGRCLVSEARQDHPTLAKLATAVESNRRLKIDWTRIRGFVDWVEQHPEQLEEAIADPPASSIRLQNVILAALAEQLADEHGIERPRWTSAFGRLDEPWSPPATTHIRERYEQDASEPFRRRNLLLPRSSFSHSA